MMMKLLLLILGTISLGGDDYGGAIPVRANSNFSGERRISSSSMSSSMLSSVPSSLFDFDQMSRLMGRLDVIHNMAAEIMIGFYKPELKSFSKKKRKHQSNNNNNSPNNHHKRNHHHKRKRICITSTCYALLTITSKSSTGTYDSIISFDNKNVGVDDDTTSKKNEQLTTKLINIPDIVENLIKSEWREGDLFQVPLLLYTILSVDDKNHSLLRAACSSSTSSSSTSILNLNSNEEDKKEDTTGDVNVANRIQKLIDIVLEARPHRRLGGRQEHSDYILYQVCKVIGLLQQESNLDLLPKSALPEGKNIRSELFWVLQRSSEVSYNELCRQLAYRTAGDSNSFDVIRLAYSLLTYIRGTKGLEGVSGKERIKGDGPSEDTKVPLLNQKLVTAALQAFFEEQNNNKDGLWDKGQPIYKNFSRGTKGSRTIDNAFVFPVNTVGSLLCALPAEAFRPHLYGLEKTLSWIESHQKVEMITTNIDEESGQCYGIPLKGWSSPHHDPDSGPKAWSTAQVLKCIAFMRKTISQLMHNDVLEEFHGTAFSKNGIQSEAWDNLLDSDLGNPLYNDLGDKNDDGQCIRTLRSVLEERIVQPFTGSSSEMSSSSSSSTFDNPSYGAAYSAVLFGPPGTAKTTICEALAKRMGYDFVVIDTAVFLTDGLSNVSARIRYVFKRLMALRKCIILFDEIEEFCLNRENPDLSMESRMLTTSMLTAINDLRRKKQSLFFIATNRLRAFDSAITRPGRFDMNLLVGTPNLQSRIIQFKQQLHKATTTLHSSASSSSSSSSAPDDAAINTTKNKNDISSIDTEKVTDSYRSFLVNNWSQDAMFMNYLEGLQFAEACVQSLIRNDHHLLTNEVMKAILQQQAAVMTIRGATREEFISSMEFTRL